MLFCDGEDVPYTFKYASYSLRVLHFHLKLILTYTLFLITNYFYVFLALFPLKLKPKKICK